MCDKEEKLCSVTLDLEQEMPLLCPPPQRRAVSFCWSGLRGQLEVQMSRVSSSHPYWTWSPVAFHETTFSSVLKCDLHLQKDVRVHMTLSDASRMQEDITANNTMPSSRCGSASSRRMSRAHFLSTANASK